LKFIIVQGHDILDLTTQTNYGYCAPPDKSCHKNLPFENNGLFWIKNQKLSDYNKTFSYHRNTGVINGRVNVLPRQIKRVSSIDTKRRSSGILSESVIKQVFAHELGHSFGAKHDDLDTTCNPSGKNDYIMTGRAKVIAFNFKLTNKCWVLV
jgi:hypothetical protein